MNKEVVVAVFIGVLFGVLGAIYLSNSKPKNNSTALTVGSVQITPQITTKGSQLATYSSLPESGSVVNSDTLNISGKAGKDSLIFAASLNNISNISIKNNKFLEKLKLKPGLNEIALLEYSNDNERLKLLKIYFYKKNSDTKSFTTESEKESSSEADLLKDKLESKVIELRESPETAINGSVKSINDKELLIEEGKTVHKIVLESEITDIYEVSRNGELTKVEIDDVTKGLQVTAFISKIGSEEKSYTVYLEPTESLVVGKVSNLDEENYQVSVMNFDKTVTSIEIQTASIQNYFDTKTGETTKYGFSKLQIGQRIIAIIRTLGNNSSVVEYLCLDPQ
jgi:hypothetical protein